MGWGQQQKQPEESSATKEGEQKVEEGPNNHDDKEETTARVSAEASTAAQKTVQNRDGLAVLSKEKPCTAHSKAWWCSL